MDDTQGSHTAEAGAKRKRRSSILKQQRAPRAPFSELEFNVTTPTDTGKSRRVSFSRRKGVAEFVTNEATTTWKNFYEEHNKTLESSGNDSEVKPLRTSVGHISKALFDQHFQDAEEIHLDDDKGRGLDISVDVNVETTRGSSLNINPLVNNIEMSILPDQQSKDFADVFCISEIGAVTDRIEVDFSDIQPIVQRKDSSKDDLDEIEKDLQNRVQEVQSTNIFTGESNSEYFELDFNTTNVGLRKEESDMSITDTIHSPKVQSLAKANLIEKKASELKDWVADKENILVVNPYVAPKESLNFNTETEKILVFDGKKLTVEEEKIQPDENFRQTLLPNSIPDRTPVARKTIVLNVNDDLPNVSAAANMSHKGIKINQTVYHENDLSLTTAALINHEPFEQRTIVYDNDACNLSLTEAVPTKSALPPSEKRKTIIYESDSGEISMTDALPSNFIGLNENRQTERRQTILYNDEDTNISITEAVPARINIRNEDEDINKGTTADVSMTRCVTTNVILPSTEIDAVHKSTNDNEMCDVSMTQCLPANIILPVEDNSNRRQTIVYGEGDCDISITQAVPTNIAESVNVTQSKNNKGTSMPESPSYAIIDKTASAGIKMSSPSYVKTRCEQRSPNIHENRTVDVSITVSLQSNSKQPDKQIFVKYEQKPISSNLNINEIEVLENNTVYEVESDKISFTKALHTNIVLTENLKGRTNKLGIICHVDETTANDVVDVAKTETMINCINGTAQAEIRIPKSVDSFGDRICQTCTISSGAPLSDHTIIPVSPKISEMDIDSSKEEKVSHEGKEIIYFNEKGFQSDSSEMSTDMCNISFKETTLSEGSPKTGQPSASANQVSEECSNIKELTNLQKDILIYQTDVHRQTNSDVIQGKEMTKTLNENKVEDELYENVNTSRNKVLHNSTSDEGEHQKQNKSLLDELLDMKSSSVLNNSFPIEVPRSAVVSTKILNVLSARTSGTNNLKEHIECATDCQVECVTPRSQSKIENNVIILSASKSGSRHYAESAASMKKQEKTKLFTRDSSPKEVQKIEEQPRESGPKEQDEIKEASVEVTMKKQEKTKKHSSKSGLIKEEEVNEKSLELSPRKEETIKRQSPQSILKVHEGSKKQSPELSIKQQGDVKERSSHSSPKKTEKTKQHTPKLNLKKQQDKIKQQSLKSNLKMQNIIKDDLTESTKKQKYSIRQRALQTTRNLVDADSTNDLIDLLSKYTDSDEERPKSAKGVTCDMDVRSSIDNKIDLYERRRASHVLRQSIPISRENLLQNISMAKDVLCGTEDLQDEDQENDYDSKTSSTTDLFTAEKATNVKKSVQMNYEVVKTLRFDDSLNETAPVRPTSPVRASSALKKKTFMDVDLQEKETEHNHDKAHVIPTYLKDVTDNLKSLMGDLMKPIINEVPFEVARRSSSKRSMNEPIKPFIDIETRKSVSSKRDTSTCSLNTQANLMGSSQIDLVSGCDSNASSNSQLLSAAIVAKSCLRTPGVTDDTQPATSSHTTPYYKEKTSKRDTSSKRLEQEKCRVHKPTHAHKRKSYPISDNVVRFDLANPLNNILLMRRPDIEYKSKSFKDSSESSSDASVYNYPNVNQINIMTVQYEMQSLVSNVSDATMTSGAINRLSIGPSKIISPMSPKEKVKDTEINTVIAMVPNNDFLKANSSLMLTDDVPEEDCKALATIKKHIREESSYGCLLGNHKRINPSPLKPYKDSPTKPAIKMRRSNSESIIDEPVPHLLLTCQNDSGGRQGFDAVHATLPTVELNKSPGFPRPKRAKHSKYPAESTSTKVGNSTAKPYKKGSKYVSSYANRNHVTVQRVVVEGGPVAERNADARPLPMPPPVDPVTEVKPIKNPDIIPALISMPSVKNGEVVWTTIAADILLFRVLRDRISMEVHLASAAADHTDVAERRVFADVEIVKIRINTFQGGGTHKDKITGVGTQFAAETLRFYAQQCGRAADLPGLVARAVRLARLADSWIKVMHNAHLHLAYDLDDDGFLSLKVVNLRLRSVWRVSMRLSSAQEHEAAPPVPVASAPVVRPDIVPANCHVSDTEIQNLIRRIKKDWRYVPRSLWKIFKYLKTK